MNNILLFGAMIILLIGEKIKNKKFRVLACILMLLSVGINIIGG